MVVTASDDNTARVLRLDNGKLVRTLKHSHSKKVDWMYVCVWCVCDACSGCRRCCGGGSVASGCLDLSSQRRLRASLARGRLERLEQLQNQR